LNISVKRLNKPTIKQAIRGIALAHLLITNGYSQSDSTVTQIWWDATLTHQFTPKLSVGGDFGYRGVASEGWDMLMIRPMVRYRFKPSLNVVGGVGSFNTFGDLEGNTYEFRLFQDFNARWPDLPYVQFFHRIRFEQRFFYHEKFENESQYRSRYLIGAESDDFAVFSKKRTFYLQTMWEGFFKLGGGASERFVNNQRAHAAFGHRFSVKFRYELHYIWQKSRSFSHDGFKTTENIIRLRFYYLLRQAPDDVEIE